MCHSLLHGEEQTLALGDNIVKCDRSDRMDIDSIENGQEKILCERLTKLLLQPFSFFDVVVGSTIMVVRTPVFLGAYIIPEDIPSSCRPNAPELSLPLVSSSVVIVVCLQKSWRNPNSQNNKVRYEKNTM